MFLGVCFGNEDNKHGDPPSPDSTPLDLSPSTMAAAESSSPDSGKATPSFLLSTATTKADPDQVVFANNNLDLDPDPDPERSADREAVALAMVTDLNKATGVMPFKQDVAGDAGGGGEGGVFAEIVTADMLGQGGSSQRKKQRKRPREDEKICLVCGDKALAHNFDAITCESCKAFFRRNALRTEPMRCLFNGACEITIQTRRFCSSCRLKKCFNVGMKADLILDDMERKARMEKVSENRAKRLAKDGSEIGDAQVGSTMASLPEFSPIVRNSTPTPTSTSSSPSPLSTLIPTNSNGRPEDNGGISNINININSRHQPTPTQPSSTSSSSSSQKAQQHQHQQHQRRRSVEGVQSQSSSGGSSLSMLHSVLTAATALADSGGGAGAGSPLLSVPGYPQSILSPPPAPHTPSPSQQQQQQPPPPHQGSQGGYPPAGGHGVKGSSTFQHVPRDLLPSDPHMYWRLSEEEKTLLTQLSSAYQATIMTLPERVSMEGTGMFHLDQGAGFNLRSIEHVFETSEKNMRQLINFVQRLGDFHMLREDDKIAVLQASCMRSMILRWTGLFVVERSTWLTQYGECSVQDTSRMFGQQDVIEELASFCHTMKTILKNDVTLFVLTHCLLLFDAREPNLVDRQLINSFRDKYLVLLKHYLESEYSFLFTDRYLQAILDRVWEIRRVAERCMGLMKEFQDFIPPLTKQLLNLQEGL